MKNIQGLTIDINKKPFQTITANRGEIGSRFLKINIIDSGLKLDLTGVTVYLYAEKSDGKKLFNSVAIKDAKNGVVLAELTSQVLLLSGTVVLTLLLIKNGSKLCSKKILLNVDDCIVDDKAIESSNEFTALTDALGTVNTIGNKADQQQVDQIENKVMDLSLDLINKANETDLAIERERINNLTKLSEGSTTGDAELMDGRIGMLGQSYENIGAAIRDQIKNSISTNVSTKEWTLSDSFIEGALLMNKEFIKGQTINFILNSNDVLNSNLKITFGVVDTEGNNIDDIIRLKPNEIGSYTFTKDCKAIRCWLPSEAKISNGKVSLVVAYPKNIYEAINDIKYLDLKKEMLGNKELSAKFENSTNHTATLGSDLDAYNYFKVEKGTTIAFEVLSDGVIKPNLNNIFLGIGYESGEKSNLLRFKPNEEIEYTIDENINYIHIWISSNDILKNGNIKLNLRNYNKNGIKDYMNDKIFSLNKEIKDNKFLGMSFSILGDSYSTYEKWINPSYGHWYSDNGNSQENNVSSVKQTWWWLLSNETKLKLLHNSSYGGSTICNTGYNSADSSSYSFVTRMKNDIGEKESLSEKPDIIFIFGGTNDNWAGAPVGDLKYNDWTDDDLKSVLPAFCYMIDYLKLWNPNARIINIVNTDLSYSISEGMKTACEYYGIENLQLKNIAKDNGHPNINGMKSIKDQILSILNKD